MLGRAVAPRRWQAAVHEAGHAVAASGLGLMGPDGAVWIDPGAGALQGACDNGHVEHRGGIEAQIGRALVLLAGPVASEVLGGGVIGESTDFRQAQAWLRAVGSSDRDLSGLERAALAATYEAVGANRAAVEAVAHALVDRGRLDAGEIAGLCIGHPAYFLLASARLILRAARL